MEKLIELLNEWSKTALENKCNWTDVYDEEGVYFLNLFDRDMTMEMEDVISKRNGFIKWLVENDKVDLDKTGYKKADFQEVWNGDWRTVRGYEMLLMLLSISNSPIDDLILYLN